MIVNVLIQFAFIYFIVGSFLKIFYPKFGICKRFCHGVLKWHVPDGKYYRSGDLFHSKCKYCGEDITKDYTGIWFKS